MSSQPSTTVLCRFSETARGISLLPAKEPTNFSLGRSAWSAGPKKEQVNFGVHVGCSAVWRSHTQEYKDVTQSGFPVIKWHETVEDDDIEGEVLEVLEPASNKIKEKVGLIRSMLCSLEDGEISVSAYDTAWVALVEDIHGSSGTPQFPSSLQWIADNQLPDGSWGDSCIFLAHDRIINTLACTIALRSWNIHPEKSEKGLVFIKENIDKLKNESGEHMPIGFEVAFPSLVEIGRKLGLEMGDDSQAFLEEIYAKRNVKLSKIPREMMHTVPTTLLHSLEGMADLEWEKLLQLQCPDGSFLFSPSSTASALMQTKDDHCLTYLNRAVHKFNGGVPNVYPVDLFEHLWVVDRLERLGISRYFKAEIKECVDYVSRYWTESGIGWARNSRVHDIDDTSMGFRILRLHGHNVSADVFQHFKNGAEFFCFKGQSNQAITGIFNLYRASQLVFPGETILEEAKKFSSKFLADKQADYEILDKWIITKNLPAEVGYALDVPWYASLPRLEARFYIEQYGGQDDVWIGKTLYRMPFVNNNIYLELAKSDYNYCQALHQVEWEMLQKWYQKCNLKEFGMSKGSLLLAYYLAAASIFEAERSNERLGWTKSSVLAKTIATYFDTEERTEKQRKAFLNAFRSGGTDTLHYDIKGRCKTTQRLLGTLLKTLKQLSLTTMVAHETDIGHQLHQAWEMWMMTWCGGEDRSPVEAQLLVRTLNLCAGRSISQNLLSHPQYRRLSDITNRVCHQLRKFQQHKVRDGKGGGLTTVEIESDMQEVAQLVLSGSSSSSSSESDGIDSNIKKTFLTIAKTFYYSAYFSPGTIHFHIAKVLFERAL